MPPAKRPSDQPRVAVAYTRVSTKREEMISPELQAHEQDTYAKSHDIPIIERVEDLDLSGREFARRSVDYIVKGVKEGRWNTVLLWKWSRWGRNLLQSRLYLAEVEQAGGEVIAVTEDFDTSTSIGKFSRDQMLVIAELQTNQMSETWKATHENRRRNGLPHTSAPRFGYIYQKDRDGYVLDPKSAPALKACYERYVNGEGLIQIVADLNANGYRSTRGNPFSRTSLAKVMDTGFAAGLIRERSNPGSEDANRKSITSFDVWRKGAHKAIVSMETWERYRDKRIANALKAPRHRVAVHTLSGLVCCKMCKKIMVSGSSGSRNLHGWRCTKRQANKSCPGATVRNKLVEAKVRDWVMENAVGGDTLEVDARRALEVQRVTTNEDAAKKEISRLKARNKRLLNVYQDGVIEKDEYEEEKAENDRDLENAERSIREAKARARELENSYSVVFTTLADLWADATPTEKNEMLSKVIKRIEIEPGTWKESKARIIPRWSDE